MKELENSWVFVLSRWCFD